MSLVKLTIKGISYSQTQNGAYALILNEVDGERKLQEGAGGPGQTGQSARERAAPQGSRILASRPQGNRGPGAARAQRTVERDFKQFTTHTQASYEAPQPGSVLNAKKQLNWLRQNKLRKKMRLLLLLRQKQVKKPQSMRPRQFALQQKLKLKKLA